MTEQDWRDLARVYRAGAAEHRRYSYNVKRQDEADVLEAQAAECVKIADERAEGRRNEPEL